jgi:hypothetical protein
MFSTVNCKTGAINHWICTILQLLQLRCLADQQHYIPVQRIFLLHMTLQSQKATPSFMNSRKNSKYTIGLSCSILAIEQPKESY